MIKLECKKIKFYSELDEHSFFERVGKIKCVKSIEGKVVAFLFI